MLNDIDTNLISKTFKKCNGHLSIEGTKQNNGKKFCCSCAHPIISDKQKLAKHCRGQHKG